MYAPSTASNPQFTEFELLVNLIEDLQGMLDPNTQKMNFEQISEFLKASYLYTQPFTWEDIKENMLHYCLTSSSVINSAMLKSLPIKLVENYHIHPQVLLFFLCLVFLVWNWWTLYFQVINYQDTNLYTTLLTNLRDHLEYTPLMCEESELEYMALILSTWLLFTIPLDSSFSKTVQDFETPEIGFDNKL